MSRNFQDWYFDRRGFDQSGDPYRNYMGMPDPSDSPTTEEGE